MKITFTGRQVELAPAQLKKLEARFAKIGKLLDGRRECEAHVILSHRTASASRGSDRQLLRSSACRSGIERRPFHRDSRAPLKNWKSRPSRRARNGAIPSERRTRPLRKRKPKRRRRAEAEREPAQRVLPRQQSRAAQADDRRRGYPGDGSEEATIWSTATPRPTASRC